MVIAVCACLPVIAAINVMAAEIGPSMAWGLRPDAWIPLLSGSIAMVQRFLAARRKRADRAERPLR